MAPATVATTMSLSFADRACAARLMASTSKARDQATFFRTPRGPLRGPLGSADKASIFASDTAFAPASAAYSLKSCAPFPVSPTLGGAWLGPSSVRPMSSFTSATPSPTAW